MLESVSVALCEDGWDVYGDVCDELYISISARSQHDLLKALEQIREVIKPLGGRGGVGKLLGAQISLP